MKELLALFDDSDPQVRTAAAVVAGALEMKSAAPALEKLLVKGASADEHRAALLALAKLGARAVSGKTTLPRVFELLASGPPLVRDAAAKALKAAGADVVADIRARREKAGEGEKRELDRVLADVGGADAFKALLDGLASADEATARNAALSVRERVTEADARTKKSYAGNVVKALAKIGREGTSATAQHEAALLKILGWCEDDGAVPVLLDVVRDDKRASSVRTEAIIALRFALSAAAADKDVVGALLDVAAGADASLARTAVDTLAGLTLDDRAAGKLASLALHRDPIRARFAVDKLRAQGGTKAAAALVDVLLRADKAIAEAAQEALAAMPESTGGMLEALLIAPGEHVRMLADTLKARVDKLPKTAAKRLIDVVIERLAGDGKNYDACLAVARAADGEATALALRELAAKLKKAKKEERAEHVLILLSHTDGATSDDKLRRALAALQHSRLDARPEARARDEALKAFTEIIGAVDVMKALKKDKNVTDEQIFFLGFHFAEEGEPVGGELLREVIARGPRTKLAKAAKNKLALEAG